MRLLKKEALFSAILLMLGVMLVSNQAVAQKSGADLTGTVVADSTMQPVADAEVSIQGLEKTATTDSQGTFSFDTVKPGTYTVVVEAAGYQAWSKEVEVTNEGKELEIRLKKAEKK